MVIIQVSNLSTTASVAFNLEIIAFATQNRVFNIRTAIAFLFVNYRQITTLVCHTE